MDVETSSKSTGVALSECGLIHTPTCTVCIVQICTPTVERGRACSARDIGQREICRRLDIEGSSTARERRACSEGEIGEREGNIQFAEFKHGAVAAVALDGSERDGGESETSVQRIRTGDGEEGM